MVLPPQGVGLGKGAGAVVSLREAHLLQTLLAVQLVVPAIVEVNNKVCKDEDEDTGSVYQ